jgi:WD40 repeat protein
MFNTVKEASERWIAEGKTYKDNLNDWLDIIYMDGKQPETPCPEETRKEMSEYVMEQIVEHNKEGKYTELRQLFPPDNDPMDWEGVAESVIQVAVLPDDRLVVTVRNNEGQRVYIINNNDFTLLKDIFLFGKSADKKFFAKVTVNEITITEGWDGPVVKTLHPPKDYDAAFKERNPDIQDGLSKLDFGGFGIEQVVVFPSGQRIALASEKGIFIIDEKGSQFIQTENDDRIDEEEHTFRFSYPHVAISPDEKYLAVGTQSSSHYVMEEKDGVWIKTATVEPRASYPNYAVFNYKIADLEDVNDGPQLLLCSCHFSRSASIALPIKNITPDFKASGYDADDTLNYVDDKKWVFTAGYNSWGYALGCNDGYIWFKTFDGAQVGYLHVGGTVMDMDFNADRTKMIVASYSGQVIIFDCSTLFTDNQLFRMADNRKEKRLDEYAITNSCYVDIKRYLFWHKTPPLVW